MTTLRLLATLAAAALPLPAVAAPDFAVGVHSSLLGAALRIDPLSQATPIGRFAEGVWTSGTALTNATVVPNPWIMDGGAGLCLTMTSYTNAFTLSSAQPRPLIAVSVNATIDTWATTAKYLYFDQDGVHIYAAQTAANSSINITDVDADAGGLLWRLKERIAYRQAYEQAMAQKGEQEASTSQEIASQLSAQIDERTETMLAPLNTRFIDEVRAPFLEPAGYLGQLHFKTEADRFVLTAAAAEGDSTEFPQLSATTPVALTLKATAIDRLLAPKLAGKAFAGDLFLDLLGPQDNMDEMRAEAQKVHLAFRAESPLTAATSDGQLAVTLHLASLSAPNLELGAVDATVRVTVEREGEALLIDLDHDAVLTPASGTLTPAQKAAAVAAFHKVIPPIAMDVSKQVIGGSLLPLHIVELIVNKDGVAASLATAAAPG